jgi:lipid-binding SYLF domain-containing protein
MLLEEIVQTDKEKNPMKKKYILLAVAFAIFTIVISIPLELRAQDRFREQNETAVPMSHETEIAQNAVMILHDAMPRIPASVIQNATGVAIIPNVWKAGFIVGGRRGTGVLLTHRGNQWSAPVFVSLTGGSVGFQAGVSQTDLVLIFQNQRSLDDLTRGDLKLGVDAAVTAGSMGASGQVPTRRADIVTYARAAGLFAGVSLNGGVLNLNNNATRDFYNFGPTDETMAYYPSANDIMSMHEQGELRNIPPVARELQHMLRQAGSGERR